MLIKVNAGRGKNKCLRNHCETLTLKAKNKEEAELLAQLHALAARGLLLTFLNVSMNGWELKQETPTPKKKKATRRKKKVVKA